MVVRSSTQDFPTLLLSTSCSPAALFVRYAHAPRWAWARRPRTGRGGRQGWAEPRSGMHETEMEPQAQDPARAVPTSREPPVESQKHVGIPHAVFVVSSELERIFP